MMCEQRDIVIVPFPFSDLSSIKQRPVFILSSNRDIASSEDVITCGLTSYLKETAHSVLIDTRDCEEGALPKPSRIKVDKLFTLDKSIIRKKIARLSKSAFERVQKKFVSLI